MRTLYSHSRVCVGFCWPLFNVVYNVGINVGDNVFRLEEAKEIEVWKKERSEKVLK